jgi:hypothetical protein
MKDTSSGRSFVGRGVEDLSVMRYSYNSICYFPCSFHTSQYVIGNRPAKNYHPTLTTVIHHQPARRQDKDKEAKHQTSTS